MSIPADERPRLVEFARLGMAVAKAVGQLPEDFLDEFNACRQESLARTIDASPVAAAVVDMIEARPYGMTAPAKEILLTLEQFRPTGCDSWPRSPKAWVMPCVKRHQHFDRWILIADAWGRSAAPLSGR